MKQSRATIRYAKSLISISKEQNSLETSFNDMLLVSSVCSSNKDFVNLLKRVDFPTFGSPMIPHLKPIFIWYEGFFVHLDIFFQ